MDYAEADKTLYTKHGVRRHSVRVGHNTWLETRGTIRIDAERREPDAIALRLHRTDVITFTPNVVIYDTNGWHTPTTMRRITQGPFDVYSAGGDWMVGDPGRWVGGQWKPGAAVPLFDGIALDVATGAVVNMLYRDAQTIRARRQEIENELVVPRIEPWVRKLKVAAGAHEWDCADCIDGGTREHLIEHLDGRWYPGALLRHATPRWRHLPPKQLRQATGEYLTDRLTLRTPLYAAA